MTKPVRRASARRRIFASELAASGASPQKIQSLTGVGAAKSKRVWRAWQSPDGRPRQLSTEEGENMSYTRQDYERDLQESLERIELELARCLQNDGSEEDAQQRADKRYELQQRARQLEGWLEASRMERTDGGYQDALRRQEQKLQTPADRSRVELDEKVKRHMEETGEENYAVAAKQLNEFERMG
jgi:hypothetical protein